MAEALGDFSTKPYALLNYEPGTRTLTIDNPDEIQLPKGIKSKTFRSKELARKVFMDLKPDDVSNIKIWVTSTKGSWTVSSQTNLDGLVRASEIQEVTEEGQVTPTLDIAKCHPPDAPSVLWKKQAVE